MMAYGVFKNVTTQSLFSGDCGSAIKVVIEYVAKLPTEQDEAECQHAKFQHFPQKMATRLSQKSATYRDEVELKLS